MALLRYRVSSSWSTCCSSRSSSPCSAAVAPKQSALIADFSRRMHRGERMEGEARVCRRRRRREGVTVVVDRRLEEDAVGSSCASAAADAAVDSAADGFFPHAAEILAKDFHLSGGAG